MFIVIFEVEPKAGCFDDYLALAKELKPKLEAMEGFIDNERFKNRRDEGRILSLSTWADEKAVVRWRTHGGHHAVQEKGRFEIFADYHLRVGEVATDTHPPEGMALAQSRFDETVTGEGTAATITEIIPAEGATAGADTLVARIAPPKERPGLLALEMFASITMPGKLALLATWRDADGASTWSPVKSESVKSLRHRRVRIIRDYGMFERREAPQFYPEVER